MIPKSVSMALLFLCFFNTFTTGSYNPTQFSGDDVSINCGSSGTSTARNGRDWLGDVQTKSPFLIQIKCSSTVIDKSISADQVPYKTARASRSQFSYSFQLNQGQKILRLHFNPVSYPGFERFKDLFTVEAGPFTLLHNFSASLTATNSFAKEFCISIEENQTLNIVFTPANGQSLDSSRAYAFVNGIEIISVPMRLSYFRGGDSGAQVIGKKSLVHVDNTTALELIHRLDHVKKGSVSSGEGFDDKMGLWASVLKENAKEINNLTWKIAVDVGFRYLVRINFYELDKKGETGGVIFFKILINDMIVDVNTNIIDEMEDNGSIWYRDYLVKMKGHKQEGKRDILIFVQSNDGFMDGQEPIKGFEVFKLSNPDNSLASPNLMPPQNDSPSCIFRKLISVLSNRDAIATVAIAIIALVNVIVHKLREISEVSVVEDENKPSARADRFCRRFSLAEIRSATNNFSNALFIGQGGFGKVYKGFIDNGIETVAVKRLGSKSKQGKREFLTEIETLSELRHINLVSLIGYCNDRKEMILVYEYMACGTLADHLYKLARSGYDCSSLTWKQRLNICIGAGRGLDYLHTGHGVIHRDVKATNILVDENFVAKVSDFGLAKPLDRSKLESHVSTKVKGTFGYFDPYYFNTRKLTRESDTYAFGVILLEVLCGRPAMDRTVGEDECTLTKWARNRINKGEVDQIVDSSLIGDISPDSLKLFIGVAERCLHDEPKNRPTMAQVVLRLGSALEKHEKMKSVGNDETISSVTPLPTGQTNRTMGNTRRQNEREVNVHKPSHSQVSTWDTIRSLVKAFKRKQLVSIPTTEFSGPSVKLPKFDLAGIAAATNKFSSSNKIGEGMIGTFYKGVFSEGLKVAVKRRRPSSLSAQGLKNEFLLIPRLHHPNIVTLLGYCLHREEMMLVYEFMEKGNLASFLYDEVRRRELEWAVRFKIITGIARGLVYLHQDSGLRVIHRCLFPQTILLDIEMNPKISTFGFAYSLAEHQSELEAKKIFRTSQFTAPECHDGKVSLKSDVYTFGVIIMVIVSGGKSIISIPNRKSHFLLDLATELWNEGKALDIVDASMGEFSEEEALRCIQVAISCIRPQPQKRPTMASVVQCLEGTESSRVFQKETTSNDET